MKCDTIGTQKNFTAIPPPPLRKLVPATRDICGHMSQSVSEFTEASISFEA